TSAWLLTIFVLLNLIGTPVLARLSDIFGRRSVYAAAIVIFGLGSAMAAAAGSMAMLLAGRAVQGFAAGGMFPVATAVVGEVFPVDRQGRALGMLGAVFGLAFLLGPLLGGLLLPFGWPWLFWVNVPVAAAVALRALRVVPEGAGAAGAGRGASSGPGDGAGRGAGAFDLPGLLWMAVGLTALALGTNALDADRFWSSLLSFPAGPALLLAVAALALFWRRETLAPAPLVKLDVMRHRPLVIANLMAGVAGVVEAGIVFVPSLLVTAFDPTPSRASFILRPAVLAMAVGAARPRRPGGVPGRFPAAAGGAGHGGGVARHRPAAGPLRRQAGGAGRLAGPGHRPAGGALDHLVPVGPPVRGRRRRHRPVQPDRGAAALHRAARVQPDPPGVGPGRQHAVPQRRAHGGERPAGRRHRLPRRVAERLPPGLRRRGGGGAAGRRGVAGAAAAGAGGAAPLNRLASDSLRRSTYPIVARKRGPGRDKAPLTPHSP